MPEERKVYCSFCGASVGEESERTGQVATAIFYCPKCMRNYCDQCSYHPRDEEPLVQRCIRCESVIEKVT